MNLFIRWWSWLWRAMASRPLTFFLTLFALSILVYTAGILRVGTILWGDTRYYYAYTRSLVVDRDLNFVNEAFRPEVGFPNPPEISTVTFRVTNKFSPGAPLLWIPGFLVGQVVGWLVELPMLLQSGGGWPKPDGYALSTQYVVALSAIALAISGLAIVFLALVQWLTHLGGYTRDQAVRMSLIVCAVLYLTTNLLYYTSIDPLNSHSASFVCSALALWVTVKALHNGWTWKWALALGSIGGMLFLVRSQDILIIVPSFVLMVIQNLHVGPKKRQFSWYGFGVAFLVVLPILVAVALQQAVVWYLFGQFGSPYVLRGEGFAWLQPDFARVLLSSGNGLFFFSPLTAVMVYGLVKASGVDAVLARLALVAFLLELYVIAAWGKEIVGGPYGSRMFVSSLPWLAVGLGEVMQVMGSRKMGRWGLVGLGLAVVNTVVQTAVMLVRF